MRPVISANVRCGSGDRLSVRFMVDTGADRTVFSNEVREALGITGTAAETLGGIGGPSQAALISTQLVFLSSDGTEVTMRGEFAAFLQDEALDMSVLGRDITNLFAVIVDKPGDTVCLLGQRHVYKIEAT